MFWLNVADNYASVVTKNLDLGCNSLLCSPGHFLIIHPSSVVHNISEVGWQKSKQKPSWIQLIELLDFLRFPFSPTNICQSDNFDESKQQQQYICSSRNSLTTFTQCGQCHSEVAFLGQTILKNGPDFATVKQFYQVFTYF